MEELEMFTVSAKKIAPVLIKEMHNCRRSLLPTELAEIKKTYTWVFAEVWENENYLDSVHKHVVSMSCQEANLTRPFPSEYIP